MDRNEPPRPNLSVWRRPEPPNFKDLLPSCPLPYETENGNIPSNHAKPTLAYLLVGPETRGKFDVEKAEKLGLKSGPLRAKLIRGETAQFEVVDENGNRDLRLVRPEEVLGPKEPRLVSEIKRCSE
jgi:hypothetical protein